MEEKEEVVKVEGIVSAEALNIDKAQDMDWEEFYSLIMGLKKEKKQLDRVTTPDMTPEERKAARNAQARFIRIREKLVCAAFDIDKKQLKDFFKQFQKGQEEGSEPLEISQADKVKNLKDVDDREYAADKERNRAILSSLFSFGAGIAMQNATVAAAVASINAALPGIGTAFSAVFLAVAVKRYFKANEKRKGEEALKHADYLNALNELIEDIKNFAAFVTANKENIMKQLEGKKGAALNAAIKEIALNMKTSFNENKKKKEEKEEETELESEESQSSTNINKSPTEERDKSQKEVDNGNVLE